MQQLARGYFFCFCPDDANVQLTGRLDYCTYKLSYVLQNALVSEYDTVTKVVENEIVCLLRGYAPVKDVAA